ncbi:alcohol dehydrogenase catalytic domain-containing protein [Neolewinella agarilytica]|uniref:Alcohol dehydrogenase n=1 Tax=Neolewinella agarilytica TaxID=478744 RepID=A0A1H9C885_9BACT|nr:zinc-binding dehydrogenase [Neolewinella agarilytica]SEP97364.1 alcohol dehydrogenase [Neolewinella agarilytica]
MTYELTAGSLSKLKIVDKPLPPPAPGEVSVAVRAIGLNFADVFAIWGLYSATPKGVFTPGLEYAGHITAVGEGVTGVSVGDAVMGVTRFGAYTSALNIDQRYVLPLPKDWTMAEGAAYLVQALTAYYGLVNLGQLRAGQTVLIHSAAGGVGTFAGRIARQLGAYTIGTIGHADKIPYLEREGYDGWIVRNKRTFRSDLLRALGERELHLIMECIGGEIFSVGFETLAPMGRSIVYGAARYGSVGNRPNYPRLLWQYLRRPKIDPQNLPEINKSVMGFNLIWLYERAELMHEILGELATLDVGKPVVGHRFAFEDLPAAVRTFQGGRTVGKVVVEVKGR